jgi:RNA polymerase-binding protein DksA
MTCHVALRVGEFERRLRRDRREVLHALLSTDEELAGLARPHRGEFIDDAAKETARCLLARLKERDRTVLAEIDAAEERLAAGTFGVCEACSRPIPFPRLRALPMARLCMACEEWAERAARPREPARPLAG